MIVEAVVLADGNKVVYFFHQCQKFRPKFMSFNSSKRQQKPETVILVEKQVIRVSSVLIYASTFVVNF